MYCQLSVIYAKQAYSLRHSQHSCVHYSLHYSQPLSDVTNRLIGDAVNAGRCLLCCSITYHATSCFRWSMNLILTRPHVANRNIFISQLLSSCCYLFIVSNSGLLSVQRPRPASHAHFRHSYIPELICGVNSSIDFLRRHTMTKATSPESMHVRRLDSMYKAKTKVKVKSGVLRSEGQ